MKTIELCQQALEAFEELTEMSVTVHVINTGLMQIGEDRIVPEQFEIHRTTFCMTTKEKQDDRCYRCDNRDLQQRCQPGDQPYVRECHAGSSEVIAPLYRWNTLVGMVFVGQFRTTSHTTRRGVDALPVLGEHAQQNLVVHTRLLATYVLSLTQDRPGTQQRVLSRRQDIEAFIDQSLIDDVCLSDLANHLGLSGSRTSHVVRDATGMSFRQLKEERRLAISRDLLVHGDASISWVAGQVGISDPNYFCRYFKRKTGASPTAYRKQHSHGHA